ncbi:ABC transporter ATP-binding protein/permease [Bifidobacterium choloepi]|uniref:ATP-binding cassette domain-containing protein n=1 Tax=Bifidobacterium choloepi TaxID=2614131 RepID=A0A6I5N2R1_9BIFI|nr:ATP-binding cassette domain-containing protein [Bifidobacterium choloepi]NEG70465.1 ATP-binding cassette domain-containing protein [Bifidobacterium choloepi]
MFDKRLFTLVPGLRRRVAAKVACMWVNLLANIALVFALVSLLGFLLMAADTHTPKLAVCIPTVSGGKRACLDLNALANAFWPMTGDAKTIWATYWPGQVIWTYVLIFACLALVKFLATRASARFGTTAAEMVKLHLREALYRKVLSLGPSYSQRVRTAAVVQSAGEGIDQIQSFYELFLPQLFYAILAPLTLFCVVAPINMPTAVVLLVCAPLIVVIVGLVAMSAARVFKQYWGKYTDMGSLFLDDLQGLETLKNFDADQDAADKMDREAEGFREMTMKVLQIQLRSLTAMDVVAYGGAAAGICTAVWQYLHGGATHLHLAFGTFAYMNGPLLTVAGVLVVILLSADFFIPLRQLGSYFHVAMNGMTSTKRIFTVLDAPEPERGTVTLPASDTSLGLNILGLGYSYADVASETGDTGSAADVKATEHPQAAASPIAASVQTEESVPLALKDITFSARPGTLTAIVGKSGSGKTTFAGILAGSLTGYRGLVSLEAEPDGSSSTTSNNPNDSHDSSDSADPYAAGRSYELGNLTAESLSRAVSVVGATSRLFSGTLRDNLQMAKPGATDAEMMAALGAAHIDGFVDSHKDGLDMAIEEDAANLSGGQRQRIAIARALLHDSPVMIFDEVTSSVDVDSEAMILDTIRALAVRKTVLLITHRLANAEHADQVVVFDHGTAVEQGTHDELMAQDGLYRTMYEAQQTVENVGRADGEGLVYGTAIANNSFDAVVNAAKANAANAAKTQQNGANRADIDTANAADGDHAAAGDTDAMSNREVVTRLLGEVGPLRGRMALACLFGIIGHLAATMLPVFGVVMIFEATGNKVWGMGMSMALFLIIACALIRGFMRYAEQYMNHNVAFRLLALFRHKAFAALRRLAPGKLEERGKGDMIGLVTTDVELLEIFFAHTISPIVIAVTTAILYIVVALALFNWGIAVLMIVAYLVIGVLLPALFAASLKRVGGRIRGESALLNDQMLEDMRGLDEIIHFGQGESRLAGIVAKSKALMADRFRLSDRDGAFAGLGNVLVIAFSAIAAFVTVATAIGDPTNIAFDIAAFVLFVSSFGPVLALSALPANLTQTFAAARRLFALMDEAPAVEENGTATPKYDGMTMHQVTFRYTSDEDGDALADRERELSGMAAMAADPIATMQRRRHGIGLNRDRGDVTGAVLDNFSLDVPVRGILGLQGPSGRGKSTMLKLLMRYWDPQSGVVFLSDKSLPEVDAHTRRHVQAMMGQETYLFDGTVRENLLLADGGADDEQLWKALVLANAKELVESLPGGLDARVGELGGRLSEGERQRLGLARVFLRNADLLLLDEPTSRLDALNEAFILQSLNAVASSRPVAIVLVSHRQSTMRVCDKVLHV